MITAYHFTGDKLRDGRPIPPIGEWLEHVGPIAMCQSGLHASRDPLEALAYARGPFLHRVECEGDVIEEEDKLVCSRRKIIASIDATALLREFARWCALSVIDKWDAPAVVREYLATGDESKRAAACVAACAAAWAAARAAASAAARAAACAAARDAACAAARDAAWAAACAAARDAAWDAQRARLRGLVNAAFGRTP